MMTAPQLNISAQTAVPRATAVVIGAGVGGLAAAMRLGARGYRVTVVDRLDVPGGRGSAIRQGGYRFDLGPTIVTAPDELRSLWSACGRDFERDVTLKPLDPFYEIRFPDGATFTANSDDAHMVEEVRKLSPRDVPGYLKFLKDSEVRYEFGFENLGRRPMNKLWDLIKVLPRFGLLRADKSVYGHVKSRVKDERLRMALSFHPLFIGGDPFHVTSMYILVAHLEKTFGVHYAMGGVAALAEAMAHVIRDQGGVVRLGETVDRITVRNGRASGVTLEGGEQVDADIVVSNADPGHTYTHLLREKTKRRWTNAKLDRKRWSMGLFVWYFGAKGGRSQWRDVGHHTILSGPRYKGLVRDIFIKGKLAEDMSLYVHRPAETDPTVAPEGDDAFYVLSPVPHLGHNAATWADERDRYRAKVLKVLEERLLPGLTERLTEEVIFTPDDFESRYLSPHGSGFSIEPRILQSAWFRPHNVSEEVDGLYIVGAGTHPGAGLPGVIASADVMSQLAHDPEVAAARAGR